MRDTEGIELKRIQTCSKGYKDFLVLQSSQKTLPNTKFLQGTLAQALEMQTVHSKSTNLTASALACTSPPHAPRYAP